MLQGGRNTASKCLRGVLVPHWVCPHSRCMCFPSLHCSGSRLLCRELCEAGLGVHALPQSKPLRFRFSGTRQRPRRLGQRFVPVPGPSSSGDQVLGEHSCPQLKAVTYHFPHSSCSVFWVYNRRAFSGVPCVSSGELISVCDPPSGCRPSRIPRNLG